MREIKFRAWDGKRMIYDGDRVYPDHFSEELRKVSGPVIVTNKGVQLWVHETQLRNATNEYFDHTSCIPITDIMQFTGLCDRNGKEIYEGDILRSYEHNYVVNVEIYHGLRFMVGKDQLNRAYAIYGEIIGNIYEHPDLIGN